MLNRDVKEPGRRSDRHLADGVVGDVALIVGVNEVLRGPVPLRERGGKLRPVRRGVHLVERERVERWIVEGPLESDGRIAGGEKRIQKRPVRGGFDIDDDIAAAAYVDGFAIDGERMPCGVEALVVALAVELLGVEILHVGVERGESPGDVLVVAGDDEGQAGERRRRRRESRARASRPCTRCRARGG